MAKTNTKKTKTSTAEPPKDVGEALKAGFMVGGDPTCSGTTEAEYEKPETVEGKLDRIIDLLTQIAGNAKNIPFQGMDFSYLDKKAE